MLADSDFMQMLHLWAKNGRLCNMHIERELASVRKSVAEKVPNLEHLAASAFLSQTLRRHVGAGGQKPGVVTRASLVESEVPIHALADRPTAVPGRARGHLLLMQERANDARKRKGSRLTRAELVQSRKDAMEEWCGPQLISLVSQTVRTMGACSMLCKVLSAGGVIERKHISVGQTLG